MILFLDYDGILHPDAVYLVRGRPTLRADGHLFMWMPVLERILADFPDVQIVLSTSWARGFGFSKARRKLSPLLQERTIAATWHSALRRDSEGWPIPKGETWWDTATRYEQIKRYVDRENVKEWLAIDDQPTGWPEDQLTHLIKLDGLRGLSDVEVQEMLVEALKTKCANS